MAVQRAPFRWVKMDKKISSPILLVLSVLSQVRRLTIFLETGELLLKASSRSHMQSNEVTHDDLSYSVLIIPM